VSHRTLSGFRSDNKTALDDLFTQVLGMLSAEGLITLRTVHADGTKIKANAGGNHFPWSRENRGASGSRRREQVRVLNQQAENEEQLRNARCSQARAARQRASRLEAACAK